MIPASFVAIRVACGQSHTVFVSADGQAWVCGRNRSGQLGLDPREVPETSSPVRLPLFAPAGHGSYTGRVSDEHEGRSGNGTENGSTVTATTAAAAMTEKSVGALGVVQAAAGRAHTMLLLSDGRVLGFGSDEFGALGVSPPPSHAGPDTTAIGAVGDRGGVGGGSRIGGSLSHGNNGVKIGIAKVVETADEVRGGEAVADAPTPPWHWRPTEIAGLRGKWVGSVSAGGEQSFAIVVKPDPSLIVKPDPSPPAPASSTTPMPTPLTRSRSPVDGESARSSTRRKKEVPSRAMVAAGVDVSGDGRAGGVGSTTGIVARQRRTSWFTDMRFKLPPLLTFESSELLLPKIRPVMPPGSRADGLKRQGAGNLVWGRSDADLVEVGFLYVFGWRLG